MTRINVGVHASELCDQHLIAEYRELPRLWNFKPKSRAPSDFVLGKGHVLWCAQYMGMLADRYSNIVSEMYRRGFKVSFPNHPPEAELGARPASYEIKRAREIVLERVNQKLTTMKRPPKWSVK